jgi:hypothetical protein
MYTLRLDLIPNSDLNRYLLIGIPRARDTRLVKENYVFNLLLFPESRRASAFGSFLEKNNTVSLQKNRFSPRFVCIVLFKKRTKNISPAGLQRVVLLSADFA